MNWVYDRQTTIYSKVRAILLSRLKSKYNDLYITEDNATPTKPKFPTVYISFIGASERGQTIENTTINAVDMTAEVHVKVSTAQGITVNQEVCWEVVDAFKSLGFNTTMPNIPVSDYDGVYESVSRFTRLIGNGDVI